MTEAIGERIRRYVLDGGDEDLRRLLSISELHAEMTRHTFLRLGLAAGGTAIDCGCGPIGALTVMAEVVGPSGRIVGVDFNESAIQRARSVVAALGLGNVELFVGDIHDQSSAALGAPFDLAFTRCFLMHQPDSVRTLSTIASLLRPGGWIVAHEPLRSPPPRSHPQQTALHDYWELLHETLAMAGTPRGIVDALPQSARSAGLEVAEAHGFFATLEPSLGFELHAATLAASRERAARLGVAVKRIDDLVGALRAAKTGSYDWVSSPFYLALALRKPAIMSQ
jgi:SAM-dependent methyltransferase